MRTPTSAYVRKPFNGNGDAWIVACKVLNLRIPSAGIGFKFAEEDNRIPAAVLLKVELPSTRNDVRHRQNVPQCKSCPAEAVDRRALWRQNSRLRDVDCCGTEIRHPKQERTDCGNVVRTVLSKEVAVSDHWPCSEPLWRRRLS